MLPGATSNLADTLPKLTLFVFGEYIDGILLNRGPIFLKRRIPPFDVCSERFCFHFFVNLGARTFYSLISAFEIPRRV